MFNDEFFFPHVLCYLNSEGVFVPHIECRDQPNSGKLSVSTERELIIYKSLIFIPSRYKDVFTDDDALIRNGAEIQIQEKDGTIRRQGYIIMYSTEALDDFRIWI